MDNNIKRSVRLSGNLSFTNLNKLVWQKWPVAYSIMQKFSISKFFQFSCFLSLMLGLALFSHLAGSHNNWAMKQKNLNSTISSLLLSKLINIDTSIIISWNCLSKTFESLVFQLRPGVESQQMSMFADEMSAIRWLMASEEICKIFETTSTVLFKTESWFLSPLTFSSCSGM